MRALDVVRGHTNSARRTGDPRGFTLAEVLIATAFVMVAFASVGVGFLRGTSSVETGRQQTTALYLAEQRLEQIKAWSLSTVAGQGFSSVAAGGACCGNEAYNTIASYGNYRRTVTVTSNGPTTKVLLVSVFYFPVNPSGGHAGNERRVDVSTLITNR
jgi:type II secretory pathway pseudopilin PulG